jgi:3-deoxy-manno-octulosonate cytidylyltransferase (CMP-KDO synthetase)
MNGSRIVAVIPARYGSSRLPGKPLADIAGRPMIQHVYERVVRAQLIDWCLVATDDERIAAAVRGFGGHAVITPEDFETGTDRVAFVARSIPDAEIIVNVQGDEPLLNPAMIDEAIRPLLDDPDAEIATLVRPIDDEADLRNPGVVKVVLDNNRRCIFFSRSAIPYVRDPGNGQWLGSHRFYKHIGLYVYRRPFLIRLSDMTRTPLEMAEQLEQLRVIEHGYQIVAAITEHDSIPVDTPADLEKVRAGVHEQE